MTTTALLTDDNAIFSAAATRHSAWRRRTPLAGLETGVESMLCFDYGVFRGFDCSTQRSMRNQFTASEVVRHAGEARFWPCGDRAGVNAVLTEQGGITGSDLLGLDRALLELGGDTDKNFARVYFDTRTRGRTLPELTPKLLSDATVRAYSGTDLLELVREAAAELLLRKPPAHPDNYQNDTLGTFRFNPIRLLTSEPWCACDLRLDDRYYLIVGETLPADPIAAVAACLARV